MELIYAIKKIPVKGVELITTIKVINEVKILAKLNHDNMRPSANELIDLLKIQKIE